MNLLFTALLTVRLAGVSLWLGGATIGDLLVLRAVRTREPISTGQLRLVSQSVWFGLAAHAVSGLGLFAFHPSTYLHSSGFVAKMIVVAILVLNGTILHRQRPALDTKAVPLLSGAISIVSWYIAMFKSQVHSPWRPTSGSTWPGSSSSGWATSRSSGSSTHMPGLRRPGRRRPGLRYRSAPARCRSRPHQPRCVRQAPRPVPAPPRLDYRARRRPGVQPRRGRPGPQL